MTARSGNHSPSQNVLEALMDHPDDPPKYTIDLSLPPSERYVQLATDFRPVLSSVTGLFDDVVRGLHPRMPVSLARFFARLLLRKVYSAEETAELRGISKACGIKLYLLVALNSLLDLLMGCTSGGVRTRDKNGGADTKMLHFRTLDWGMDSLRKLVVQLEFVNQKGGSVIARSITYAGFVGVLTGVRQGLSMSLNFRPDHNGTSPRDHFHFYRSQLLVLLGRRSSIASIMRIKLLSSTLPALQTIASDIPSIPSTAAYLIFSDGGMTMVIEKDYISATTRRREDFIVATNHDRADENKGAVDENVRQASTSLSLEFLAESVTRKLCIRQDWRQEVFRAVGTDPGEHDATDGQDEDFGVSVKRTEVISWLEAWPVTNECTHYAVVMDPKEGEVIWLRRFLEPVDSVPGDSNTSDNNNSEL